MPDVLDVVSAREWEAWLKVNHATVTEGVWLKMQKKGSPDPGPTYVEAVEAALCYGWIDGQTKPFSDSARLQKFTPRRQNSSWSKINVGRAEALIRARRMRAPGLREIERAKADGRWDQAYSPPSEAVVPEDFLKELRKNKKALAFFKTLNKRNTYPIVYRLQTAKKPETRVRRIQAMIEQLARGEKFHE
jgi:uncharacterized protein YdeI (YjbR/CyaY-like superfamily)